MGDTIAIQYMGVQVELQPMETQIPVVPQEAISQTSQPVVVMVEMREVQMVVQVAMVE